MDSDAFERLVADLEGVSVEDGIDENPVSATTLLEDDLEDEPGKDRDFEEDVGGSSSSGVSSAPAYNPPPAASFLEECSFVLPRFDPDVVQAFVLSKWDHILGPRAVHVWLLENPEEPAVENNDPASPELRSNASPSSSAVIEAVHYVVDHSLNAADAGEPSGGAVGGGAKCAFFVVPRDRLVSVAVCFHVTEVGTRNHVAYSLSLVADSRWLDFIVSVQPLVQETLQIQSAKFRVYFSQENLSSPTQSPDWVTAASDSFADVCEMLSSLQSHPVSNCLPLMQGKGALEDGVGEEANNDGGNVMNLMADKRFFERALTAHLQTGGRSLVVGSHEKTVSTMLGILSLFLTDEEKASSTGVVKSRKFFPLLYLQGYMVDPSGVNFIPASTLLESPAPLSIIDVNRSQVRQTALRHIHSKLHLVALKSSLMALRDSQARAAPVSEMILHIVRDGSPLVMNLVKEILKVPPVLWEYVIGLFMREVSWRAYALVQIVEDETNWINQDIDVGSAKQPMYKYLQSLVSGGVAGPASPEDGDFLIVLAAAEKISPGIYNYVMNKKIAM